MAEAMSGAAMGLPQEQNPVDQLTPENLAAFEQLRQQVSPQEFNKDLLDTASEADPQAVAEFKAELRGLELPPEAMDALNQMVDEILASPQDYPQIREKYLAQDIPEDLLPPVFDPEFFAALNMAVDEIRASSPAPQPEPQNFARGGIAELKPIAAAMAQQGRYGDTMLAHISPREAMVLRRMGGSGTVNPVTGLPEFFLKKLFKGVGKVFKKIGSAVKKFASSTVGRIVTSIALGFFLGPAAASFLGVTSSVGVAAVSGFVGGAGSTLAAGGNLKDALKVGAIGGLTAGAIGGVAGGAEAFQAGSYQGATTISGQVEKARDFFTGAGDSALPDVGESATEAVRGDVVGGTEGVSKVYAPEMVDAAGITRTPMQQAGAQSFPAQPNNLAGITRTQLPPSQAQVMPGDPFAAPGGATIRQAGERTAAQQAAVDRATAARAAAPTAQGVASLPAEGGVVPTQGPMADLLTPTAKDFRFYEAGRGAAGEVKPSFLSRITEPVKDFLSPKARAAVGQERALTQAADKFYGGSRAALDEAIRSNAVPDVVTDFISQNSGGMLYKYGPLAAAGLGVMSLLDKEEEGSVPAGWEDFAAGVSPGARLLAEQPSRYGLQFGGVRTVTPGAGYSQYGYYSPLRKAAKGSSPQGETKFPRKNGHISGPGTGTSDDIPAMLSDGEFVFTAKAVRNMGNGSRRLGAKKMYALMKQLEGRKNG
jgi:hypothetical protein